MPYGHERGSLSPVFEKEKTAQHELLAGRRLSFSKPSRSVLTHQVSASFSVFLVCFAHVAAERIPLRLTPVGAGVNCKAFRARVATVFNAHSAKTLYARAAGKL